MSELSSKVHAAALMATGYFVVRQDVPHLDIVYQVAEGMQGTCPDDQLALKNELEGTEAALKVLYPDERLRLPRFRELLSRTGGSTRDCRTKNRGQRPRKSQTGYSDHRRRRAKESILQGSGTAGGDLWGAGARTRRASQVRTAFVSSGPRLRRRSCLGHVYASVWWGHDRRIGCHMAFAPKH